MWESGVRNNGRQLAWGAPPVRPPHARARLASGGGLSGGSYGQRPQLEPLFDSGVRTARPFLFGNSRGSVSGFGTTWTQSSFGGGLFGNTLSQNGAVFGHGTGDSYIDGLFEEQPRFLDGLIDLVSC
ncbi:hypothetical protein K461DRAFT_282270 [Myriangium duriaei CBS 260.36]|uniref:Uncharacterized protein n=1 Tax=Myriangium duriaei CBS 260.36 TaxID=1168546 RepID=A0A9P4IW39_9PEZI|nr:hypothetical protein K461DRAFT_282270 [Myriangium duriaei CBS 260.36]